MKKQNKKPRITFEDYQKLTGRNLIKPGLNPYLAYLMYLQTGLSEEAGEFAGLVKKVARDRKGKLTEKIKRRMAKELGDSLWQIARIADHLGFTLADVAEFNVQKLSARIKRGTVSGRSDDHR